MSCRSWHEKLCEVSWVAVWLAKAESASICRAGLQEGGPQTVGKQLAAYALCGQGPTLKPLNA